MEIGRRNLLGFRLSPVGGPLSPLRARTMALIN